MATQKAGSYAVNNHCWTAFPAESGAQQSIMPSLHGLAAGLNNTLGNVGQRSGYYQTNIPRTNSYQRTNGYRADSNRVSNFSANETNSHGTDEADSYGADETGPGANSRANGVNRKVAGDRSANLPSEIRPILVRLLPLLRDLLSLLLDKSSGRRLGSYGRSGPLHSEGPSGLDDSDDRLTPKPGPLGQKQSVNDHSDDHLGPPLVRQEQRDNEDSDDDLVRPLVQGQRAHNHSDDDLVPASGQQQRVVGTIPDPEPKPDSPTGGQHLVVEDEASGKRVVVDDETSPVGQIRDSGTTIDGMPMPIGGNPITDAENASRPVLEFVQQYGSMHTQWHLNRNTGRRNDEGFLIFHHNLIGRFERAGGPVAFEGITPYTQRDFVAMGIPYTVDVNTVQPGDINSLRNFSDGLNFLNGGARVNLESWHNNAHMSVAIAAGIDPDIMMNPSINMGLREFWRLHYFIEQQFNQALRRFNPNQAPSVTIAQLEQSDLRALV